MRRRLLVATGLMLALAGTALSAGAAYAFFWDESQADVIAPGVTIAGVDVGGLHAAAAEARLDATLVPRLERPVAVLADGRRFTLAPSRAGLRVDVAHMVAAAVRTSRSGGLARRLLRRAQSRRLDARLPLAATLSPAELSRFVDGVALAVDRTARNARAVPTAVRLRIVPELDGLALGRAALRRLLTKALLDPNGPRTIDAPVRTLLPRWTTATLPQRYGTFILVSRPTFTLRLYKHLKLVRRYRIAVGMAGLETPAGLYRIDDKQVNPSWHVPLSAWAGSLAGQVIPPGPSDPIKARWLGFHNGAGIHGTDEISSIGSAASHGCIRMSISDVEQLYPLVPLHTPIYVG